MSERPVTPYNWRLMSAARDSLRMRPSAETLIAEHIKEREARGEDLTTPTSFGEAYRERQEFRWALERFAEQQTSHLSGLHA